MSSIGDRVLQSLGQNCPDLRHREVAVCVGITPDAFSRALSGQRRFASVELARLSEITGADLHWLITGEKDPNRLIVAARHDFNHVTGKRTVPGREGDAQILEDIALAYRQGYPEPVPTRTGRWPMSPAEVRETLGSDFVRPFADRLEECLGIDVVRVQELSTAYSLTIGGWAVIAIPATANWFRENWDLGHELDHLVCGHHDEGISRAKADKHEAEANAFAAELLLPAQDVHGVNWDSVSDGELAHRVWEWGVSTDALCRRLKALDGQIPVAVAQWAAGPTQRLLRHHLAADSDYGIDKITERMDQAAQRRFPLHLQEAHLKRIAAGAISSATLAWMLGIDPSMLEVDSPEVPEVDADDLAAALGL